VARGNHIFHLKPSRFLNITKQYENVNIFVKKTAPSESGLRTLNRKTLDSGWFFGIFGKSDSGADPTIHEH